MQKKNLAEGVNLPNPFCMTEMTIENTFNLLFPQGGRLHAPGNVASNKYLRLFLLFTMPYLLYARMIQHVVQIAWGYLK